VEIDNARVIAARSEDWATAAPPAGGREAYDAVTVRAVSSLAANAELASPLLRKGGILVTWKGERRPDEEALAARTAADAGMVPVEVVPVTPYPESRHRHLHVVRKAGPTPQQLPRRAGAAAKRPLGS
jgi:16S rRNA (guanine527-N7)-methyltransferase